MIYLKSNFEHLRGNHKKAMKMLGSVSTSDFTEAGECMPVMYNNNLGCIHFHLSKHHLGAFHFRKAFQENENALKDIKRGVEHSKLAVCFVDTSVFLDCFLFEQFTVICTGYQVDIKNYNKMCIKLFNASKPGTKLFF